LRKKRFQRRGRCVRLNITQLCDKVKTPDGSDMRWSDTLGIMELNLRLEPLIPPLKPCASGLKDGNQFLCGVWKTKVKLPKSKGSGIDPDQRQKAIELKRKLKSWGALRIKREFNLSISEKAIRKIWKEEGLLKKRRRKHKTKNDLRKIPALGGSDRPTWILKFYTIYLSTGSR
jgi:hypothetical protein